MKPDISTLLKADILILQLQDEYKSLLGRAENATFTPFQANQG